MTVTISSSARAISPGCWASSARAVGSPAASRRVSSTSAGSMGERRLAREGRNAGSDARAPSSRGKPRGRIVWAIAEGVHGGPELRAARLARLFQLPGLPPVAPALGMEPAGVRQEWRGRLPVPPRAEILAESEAGRRARVLFVENGQALPSLLLGQGIGARGTARGPVAQRAQVGRAHALPLGQAFRAHLLGRPVEMP